LQLINPSTSPNELNTTLTPHSIPRRCLLRLLQQKLGHFGRQPQEWYSDQRSSNPNYRWDSSHRSLRTNKQKWMGDPTPVASSKRSQPIGSN